MVRATARRRQGYTHDVEIQGGHHLVIDEPEESGGANQGASPTRTLAATLAACAAITMEMYADRKGWPLDGVEVRLRHDRIHAEDCAECETREGFLDRITKQLTLHGKLDDEQRARLAEIAERCPVQRTLQREIAIEQRLA